MFKLGQVLTIQVFHQLKKNSVHSSHELVGQYEEGSNKVQHNFGVDPTGLVHNGSGIG